MSGDVTSALVLAGNVGSMVGMGRASLWNCGKSAARGRWKQEHALWSDDSLDGSVDGLQHVFAHGTLVARGTLAVHENSHGPQEGSADPHTPHLKRKKKTPEIQLRNR